MLNGISGNWWGGGATTPKNHIIHSAGGNYIDEALVPSTVKKNTVFGLGQVGLLEGGQVPGTATQCTVAGKCVDVRSNPVSGVKVTATIIGNKVKYTDSNGAVTSIGSDPIRTETDTNGEWSLALLCSSHLYQGGVAGVQYKITLKGRGLDESKDVTIPDLTTVRYESL